ncbi:MAG: HAMP domain-containing histidine kinase [Planctomycetes bacterium]|nr:HAMP domain-containing histidine kinase [Planctomycetota bacterium]
MSPNPRPGAAWRERGVLLLGVVSALVLVVAAFLPANDPETVARTALAQLAARTEQAVVDEWQRSLRDPAPIALASSAEFVFDPAALPVAALARRPVPELPPDPDDAACAALLAEAERLDLRGDEPAEVRALVAEALAKRPSRPQRVAARLLLLRREMERGERAAASTTLRALLPEFEERDPRLGALGRTCALVAAPLASDPEVLSVWQLQALVDPAWIVDAHALKVQRMDAPRVWYWIEGLPALDALRARFLDLRLAFVVNEWMEHACTHARLRALEERIGPWPDDGWTTAWNVLPRRDDFFARVGTANGPWTGFFVTRDDLGAALVERLRAGELLPEGMELDFDGGRDALGVALRPRVELVGREFAFTLRHEDPEALVRSQSRRQSWLRAALFVMAAFAAGAGFAMARALRRERKLAELKTTFIANVSHELRTPLASILLMAENLEAGRTRDPEAARRYHGLIRREALRLARLVDDVLDFARLERGKRLDVRREDVDPRAVVEEWSAEFRAWAAEHALELDIDVRDLPASAALDKDALRRALFNLLDNARKHSGSKRVRFEARGAGHELVLRVADHGIGIPRGKRASVFEPFERLREGGDAAPGTGLGLAIVREIVLAHGGTIALRDPEHGCGAVFELCLPCDRNEEEDE